MSKGFRITLITIGALVAIAGLLLVGINIGRATLYTTAGWAGAPAGVATGYTAPWTGGMMGGYGMMGSGAPQGYAYGMMGPGMTGGYGMMGSGAAQGYGYGMMGSGMMGGYGMMGPRGYGAGQLLGVEPLTIAEARAAVQDYLDAIEASELEIGEVMIFDNHAYVQVTEQDSGIGAFELLVDPVTLAVYPEHGPNMMWNLKYRGGGMMGGYGTGGMMGMMGGYGMMGDTRGRSFSDLLPAAGELDPSDQPIDAEQALQIGQDYLDSYLPGTELEQEADAFYGYYTIHILRDGDTVGMLSVNGLTGQVWLHNWHGELIEMSEHD